MTAQDDTAVLVAVYVLLAIAVAGLVALVFFAVRVSRQPRSARAHAESTVLGLLEGIAVVTVAVAAFLAGLKIGKIGAPNDEDPC